MPPVRRSLLRLMFTNRFLLTIKKEDLSTVLTDGLACFRLVVTAGCSHTAVVTGERHPNVLPQLWSIFDLLGNLKTSFSGTIHACILDKYDKRFLGSFCFLFNRWFRVAAMTQRITSAICRCKACPKQALRVAELCARSRPKCRVDLAGPANRSAY
jgi:hypothetical protein